MVYSTCKSIFLNQGTVPLEYCRKDWVNGLLLFFSFIVLSELNYGIGKGYRVYGAILSRMATRKS